MYGSYQVIFKWAAGMACFCSREIDKNVNYYRLTIVKTGG